MFRFEEPKYFYALAFLPVVWLILLWVARWKKKARKQAIDQHLLKRLAPRYASSTLMWSGVLFSLAYAAIVGALANPQIGSKMEEVKREGIDLMICLDVSNSMLAEDLSPNRLERAKRAMSQLVDRLKGDRIGIVVFAGQAFVQLPITTDYAAAKLFLNDVNTNTIALQGTNMGAAIDLAAESFDQSNPASSKAIIVITDGENHEDDAIEAAERASKNGIQVFTIGMGSEKGAPIPLYRGNRRMGFMEDKYDQTIITQLDAETLTEVADAGNGFFQRATNANAGLDAIFDEISGMEKTEYGTKLYTDYEDRYPYLLGLALFFICIELVITNRKAKWIAQLNLFNQ